MSAAPLIILNRVNKLLKEDNIYIDSTRRDGNDRIIIVLYTAKVVVQGGSRKWNLSKVSRL